MLLFGKTGRTGSQGDVGFSGLFTEVGDARGAAKFSCRRGGSVELVHRCVWMPAISNFCSPPRWGWNQTRSVVSLHWKGGTLHWHSLASKLCHFSMFTIWAVRAVLFNLTVMLVLHLRVYLPYWNEAQIVFASHPSSTQPQFADKIWHLCYIYKYEPQQVRVHVNRYR